jgi:hypothetical protein
MTVQDKRMIVYEDKSRFENSQYLSGLIRIINYNENTKLAELE